MPYNIQLLYSLVPGQKALDVAEICRPFYVYYKSIALQART